MGCPAPQNEWVLWGKGDDLRGWITRPSVHAKCHQACCTTIEFEGWPSGVNEEYAGIFTKIGIQRYSRPVYKNSNGKFLYYWEPNTKWRIGNSHQDSNAEAY